MLSVEVLVDLHASNVDKDRTAFPGLLEGSESLLQAIEVIGFAFDIHGIRLKAALPARFRQSDRIEYALWNSELGSRRTDRTFTVAQARRSLRRTADQGECRERR